MTWYRITTAGQVYVRDPALHFVHADDGRLLTAAELLETWRQAGAVEALPVGTDPEQVMRESRRPLQRTGGGNVGDGGRRR